MAGFHDETGFDVEISATDQQGRSRRYTKGMTVDARADKDLVVTKTGKVEFKREVFKDENLPDTIVIAFEKDDGWQSFEYVLSDAD
jgi:hypothetical protein